MNIDPMQRLMNQTASAGARVSDALLAGLMLSALVVLTVWPALAATTDLPEPARVALAKAARLIQDKAYDQAVAALDHLGEPERFVSAAATFDLDESRYQRMIEAGSNPYEVVGLVK